MKLIFSSLFLLLQISLFAQNWFQDDDHWVYNIYNPLSASIGILEITVEKDTFILGQNAKVLKLFSASKSDFDPDTSYNEITRYVYEENKKIYSLDLFSNSFELNYDFNILPGDVIDYEIITFSQPCGNAEYFLDSLSTVILDSDTLTVQHFTVYDPYTDSYFNERIVERIGVLDGLYDIRYNHQCATDKGFYNICTYNDSPSFIDILGYECLVNLTSVEEKFDEFKIYPNPTSDIVFIESEIVIQSIIVKDIHGTELLQTRNSDQIDTSDLPSGIYFLIVSTDSQHSTHRIIKQ